MAECKCNISIIIVLVSLFSTQAFSQQNYSDSPGSYKTPESYLKPSLHYSIGSSFLVIPHMGNVTGFTVSPYLSMPLSPKLSVDGGIIAGRYYPSLRNISPENNFYGSFNEISLYGSARYNINSQLTLYGTGVKQLAGTSPYISIPKSSYTFGSTYNFGNFSIGVAVQMSKWNNTGLFPGDGSQGFYSPFEQRPPGTLGPFGQ